MAIKQTPRLTPRAMGMWAGLTKKTDVLRGAMDTEKRMKPMKVSMAKKKSNY
jgi:hypothetical protein